MIFLFISYIENNTWACIDMEIFFSCSTQYLAHLLRSLVRYQVEHRKRNSISTSNHVSFCLLCKDTDDGIFDDFLKISKDFPKLFQRLI